MIATLHGTSTLAAFLIGAVSASMHPATPAGARMDRATLAAQTMTAA